MSPDPVQLGLVASLARPDANITGTTTLSVDLSIKQLELLKEAIPRASRIAVLWNPDNPWHPLVVRSLPKENQRLGVQLQLLEIRSSDDINNAFQTMIRERADAVIVLADPLTTAHRGEIAAMAAKHHLPSIGGPRSYTEAGGLMSFWADEDELTRRAASYVDKILKGASPERLPIEQPTKYDLFINLRTAKSLAVTIPQSQLMRATTIE
jgi:putative ABC transport system substrate-binding protein